MKIDRFQEVERFFINEFQTGLSLPRRQTGVSLRPGLQEFVGVECNRET